MPKIKTIQAKAARNIRKILKLNDIGATVFRGDDSVNIIMHGEVEAEIMGNIKMLFDDYVKGRFCPYSDNYYYKEKCHEYAVKYLFVSCEIMPDLYLPTDNELDEIDSIPF